MNCNEYKFSGAWNVIPETEAANWNGFFPYPEPFCSRQEYTQEISQVCFLPAATSLSPFHNHGHQQGQKHCICIPQQLSGACPQPGAHLQSNTVSHRLWSSVQAVGCPPAMIARCQGIWQIIPLEEQWVFTERRWQLADRAAGTVWGQHHTPSVTKALPKVNRSDPKCQCLLPPIQSVFAVTICSMKGVQTSKTFLVTLTAHAGASWVP